MVASIVARLSQQAGVALPTLAEDAQQALADYDYPGNVRELENILERAMALCDGNTIRKQDLYLTENGNEGSAESITLGERNLPLHEYLDKIEREQIMKALEQTRYNKTQAAKLLGITFRSLRYRLDRLGIE